MQLPPTIQSRLRPIARNSHNPQNKPRKPNVVASGSARPEMWRRPRCAQVDCQVSAANKAIHFCVDRQLRKVRNSQLKANNASAAAMVAEDVVT
jgi:hypothetical protein